MTEVRGLPTSLSLEDGCYLTFEVTNGGTLFLNWVSSAGKMKDNDGTVVGYFKPKKAVPAFKQNTKVEVIRGFQGAGDRFFNGFCSFLKIAKDFDSEVCLLTDSANVFVRKASDGLIVQLNNSKFEQVNGSISAVVALPENNDTVTDGLCMMQEQFIRIGRSEGGFGMSI